MSYIPAGEHPPARRRRGLRRSRGRDAHPLVDRGPGRAGAGLLRRHRLRRLRLEIPGARLCPEPPDRALALSRPWPQRHPEGPGARGVRRHLRRPAGGDPGDRHEGGGAARPLDGRAGGARISPPASRERGRPRAHLRIARAAARHLPRFQGAEDHPAGPDRCGGALSASDVAHLARAGRRGAGLSGRHASGSERAPHPAR